MSQLKPRILVFGVGGAGGNAVNNMIAGNLRGVEFVAANTDAQHLILSQAPQKIQLGAQMTGGLGAGAQPEVGRLAAEESIDEILDQLDGADMVFVTAGMGGGTGTGAAPVVAKAARQRGLLTVGVVTKPFQFEGRHRMRQAEEGIAEMERYIDTLIVIPNQNLFRIATAQTTFADAFTATDDMGRAMMGTGEAHGDGRALMAVQNAISNPLLDNQSLMGAAAVLVNVTGGSDLTLLELDEAASLVADQADPDANIIFGAAFDDTMEGRISVSVVATGMAQPPSAL